MTSGRKVRNVQRRTGRKPIPFSYMSLAGKHLDEKMHPGTLLSLSTRGAIVAVTCPLESYANIMLRLEAGAGDEESELYAKVIHPLDESIRRYLIHLGLARRAGVVATADRRD
jgi:hypothetical protein